MVDERELVKTVLEEIKKELEKGEKIEIMNVRRAVIHKGKVIKVGERFKICITE